MFASRNAGKCFLYAKCGCVPGICTEKIFQKFCFIQAQRSESTWDYLKSKLGLQKQFNKRNVMEDMDPREIEPETIELPVHSNSTEEMWKPGYRGRTENKRY